VVLATLPAGGRLELTARMQHGAISRTDAEAAFATGALTLLEAERNPEC
jgi:hypothetical protein